jgi:hypothetical protein
MDPTNLATWENILMQKKNILQESFSQSIILIIIQDCSVLNKRLNEYSEKQRTNPLVQKVSLIGSSGQHARLVEPNNEHYRYRAVLSLV